MRALLSLLLLTASALTACNGGSSATAGEPSAADTGPAPIETQQASFVVETLASGLDPVTSGGDRTRFVRARDAGIQGYIAVDPLALNFMWITNHGCLRYVRVGHQCALYLGRPHAVSGNV